MRRYGGVAIRDGALQSLLINCFLIDFALQVPGCRHTAQEASRTPGHTPTTSAPLQTVLAIPMIASKRNASIHGEFFTTNRACKLFHTAPQQNHGDNQGQAHTRLNARDNTAPLAASFPQHALLLIISLQMRRHPLHDVPGYNAGDEKRAINTNTANHVRQFTARTSSSFRALSCSSIECRYNSSSVARDAEAERQSAVTSSVT
jgi:hypothetical protein